MNAEEKIEALTDYYVSLDEEMQDQSVPQLMLVLKAMILHIAQRTGVSVTGLLAALAQSYVEKVEVNRGKSDAMIRELLLDEMAKQEEHSDA